MKGYIRKCERRKLEGMRIHRTSEESSGDRYKKKMLGKITWYRGRRNKDDKEVTDQGKGGGDTKKTGALRSKNLRTRAVMFVEQMPQGELAKKMRE